ncbi:DUF4403 family protein, partial [Roseisolibacter sp. H3M3-2]|uniref:DUF4403 family protein n=1 Tax=Roseisolibacter sp. H3M3-2 TaxID=3031323 RepID=UPI0023DC565E
AACGRSALASAARTARDAAPEPALPALLPSELDVPVVYELAPAVAALEAAVPRTFGDMAERRSVPGRDRLQFAFAAERTPFDVRVRGATATVAATVSYRARGWYAARFAPDVSGSCGLGDASPRLRIVLATTVRLDETWRLRPRTRLVSLAPVTDSTRDRCRVTAARFDVTDRVLSAVRGKLEDRLAAVDAGLARADVKSKVERWWELLQRPIRIRDSLWLEIRPRDVRLGAPSAEDGALVAPLALTAQPHLVTGPRPTTPPTPLPALGARAAIAGDSAPTGLRVRLDAEMGYDDATHLLAPRMVERALARGGRRVRVRRATVAPAPGGSGAVDLDVEGDVAGRVYVVGRPVYDAPTGELRVPDLDFVVDVDHPLVRGLDWLRHDELRDLLRARARWPAAALVDSARVRLERALNRDLTQGVSLAAEVPTARVLAVYAAREGVVLRAEAQGEASLRVRRAPPMPKRRRPAPAAAAASGR